jgi:hypothetical protein
LKKEYKEKDQVKGRAQWQKDVIVSNFTKVKTQQYIVNKG